MMLSHELERFVSRYIAPRWRARWRHILIESPTKGRRELHKFARHRDERRCRASDTEDMLQTIAGYAVQHCEVVCFDARYGARIVAPAEIADMVLPYPDDMIVVLPESGRAVVFSHDGDGWTCQ
jgi:hypothetical protein